MFGVEFRKFRRTDPGSDPIGVLTRSAESDA
jgi:hypothetical protein